jgi:hypothetical protein
VEHFGFFCPASFSSITALSIKTVPIICRPAPKTLSRSFYIAFNPIEPIVLPYAGFLVIVISSAAPFYSFSSSQRLGWLPQFSPPTRIGPLPSTPKSRSPNHDPGALH